MHVPTAPALALILAPGLLAGAALSASGAAAAAPVFERLSSEGGDPCFARAYDEAHLARHPHQRVVRFTLRRERVDVPGENGAERFTVRIAFRLRSDHDAYATNAICTPAGRRADCTGEGDTGTFRLELSGAAIRVAVERLEVEGQSGASPDLAGSDDRVFLLRPAPAEACAGD